jgi:hydroxymethylpyrimidine pyrophosphatase-like HAD family hydrolase
MPTLLSQRPRNINRAPLNTASNERREQLEHDGRMFVIATGRHINVSNVCH